jgi:hypothetical protein
MGKLIQKPFAFLESLRNSISSKHDQIIYILAFIVFVTVRGVAEILAGNLPAGWDPLNYYAPWTISYMNQGILNQHFIGAPPTVFILTILMTSVIQNVWLAIKILAPILYGVLGVSFLYFSRSYLCWNPRKSMVGALMLMAQPAALRISWDLFKNQLAISLLFFQLPLIFSVSKKKERKTKLATIILSLLIVLTHQLVAVIYFVILLNVVLRRNAASLRKYLLCANLPAIILFISIFGIYSRWGQSSFVSYSGVGTIDFFKVIHYVDAPTFSVFKDYISLYGSYYNLFVQTMTLFFILYASLLPLAIFGFWNDNFLTPFLIFNLIGTFFPLISPSFALMDSVRWVFMLVYPFSIYSTNALFKLVKSSEAKRDLA